MSRKPINILDDLFHDVGEEFYRWQSTLDDIACDICTKVCKYLPEEDLAGDELEEFCREHCQNCPCIKLLREGCGDWPPAVGASEGAKE